MKKVITTMLVAAMVLSMAVPTSAATITRKKSTGTSASTTKVSGDYSLKMVDKTLQFIRGGKVVSSIETKDGKITLRKSSAGGISVVFTDANGKRRNITLGKQDSVSLSGTFTQVSVDKALGSSFEVEMEKGSKVTNFYAKGAAKVTLNGSVTTLNVTSSNANVAANGTVSRAYAVNKKAITGMSSGKITQTSTGTSASGSVNTSTGSSSSSNTTVNSGSGSSGSSSSGSGIIINGGGSNNGGNTTSKKNPTVSYKTSVLPTYDEGTVLTNAMLEQFGLKATYGNTTVAGTFSWTTANTKVLKGTYSYSVTFTPKDTKTYNTVRTSVKIEGKAVQKAQTLAEAKAAIEAALKSSGFTNETTEAQIQKLADDCITSSDIQAVAKVTIVKATETAEGTIKGTIELTKGAEKETVTVDIKIAKLSALDAAKAEVETVLNGFTATKETDKAAIETALAEVIAKYKDVKISVGEVVLDETAKTVSVKVSLTEGDSEPVEVSKTWTYTEQASALEEAKAKVVAALDGITASKDIDKAAIEAALADIKAEYPTVEITVGDVVPNETAKTVSVEVSLKEGDKTDKVAKTWDYSGQAVAKKPTFTKHPEAPATGSDVTLSKDTPVTLEVAANVDGSTEGVTYQWYRSTSSLVDNATARTAIDGATSATYTLAPEDEGRFYFFAEAIHTVGDKTASSFSKNVLLTVTVPEGSAVAKPEFTTNLGNKKESVAVGVQKVLTIDTKAVTLPTKTTYQWYMSTDPENPLNGTAITGETGKTLTVKNNTIGVTSYYCVATNTTTADVDFNNRTATSEYTTITVTSSIGFSAAAVTDATKGTTAIDVTFTKDITGLSAENFKVEGKEETKPDGTKVTPKITVDRVESFTDNLKKYTLHVSGIDLDGIATVTVVPPAGITVSDPKVQEVNIIAPTEVVSVTGFSVAKTSDEGETTQLKVTFDKAISSAASSYVVAMTSKGNIVTAAKVDPADDHSVLLDVVLSTDPDELEATLTTANGTALATADQKKVDVTRDTKAPKVTSINLGSDNKQIELAMSEPLADATLDKTEFTLVDKTSGTAGATTITKAEIDASTNNTMIVLTASAPVDVSALKLKYTAVTPINDRAAAPNALAAFTEAIEGTVLPDTLTVQAVEVTAANKAVVKMNAPIESTATPTELQNLFVAKDQKTGDTYTIASVTPITASKGRAVTQSINGFEITFNPALPAGAVVVISINPTATTVADKIAIAGKPDAKLPVNQDPVVAPEVKVATMTYGTQKTITEGTLTKVDEVYAAPSIANFTPKDSGAFAMALTASGNEDNAFNLFTIDPDTGVISTAASGNLVAGTTDVTVTATDADNKTVSVDVTITVSPKGATAAPDITGGSVAPGSAANTTKITNVSNADGNTYKVVVSSTTIATPNVGDDASAIGTAYAIGNDISGVSTTDKFVGLYEVDGSNKVVAFHLFELKASDINTTTPDATAPTVTTTGVVENSDPTKLVLTATEEVTGTPDPTDFTVTTNSQANTVTNVAISNKTTITLTLTTAVKTGETVTVAYTKNVDAAKQIKDTAGNVMDSFTDSKVTVTNKVQATVIDVTGTVTVNNVPTVITTTSNLTDLTDAITVTGNNGLDANSVKTELVVGGNVVSTVDKDDVVTVKITVSPATGYKIPDNAAGITVTGFTPTKVGNDLVLTSDSTITVTQADIDAISITGLSTAPKTGDTAPTNLTYAEGTATANWTASVDGSGKFEAGTPKATITVTLTDGSFKADLAVGDITLDTASSNKGTISNVSVTNDQGTRDKLTFDVEFTAIN